MTLYLFDRRWRPIWVVAFVIAAMAVGLNVPSGRRLARRMFASLRVQKVQAVNVDLSAFVGPNANAALHQMIGQMISDTVTVTVNEKDQPVSDAVAASQLVGFSVHVLHQRTSPPRVVVGGAHAFTLIANRTRLQAIFNEAGRRDLSVPPAVDAATVTVQIPRTVRVQYGTCPGPTSATANVATPTPASTQYSDCLIVTEGHSPVMHLPPGLDVEQLAQIGLELTGMSPSQAHEFLQTVDWRSMLGLPVPRALRSYQIVPVSGVQGTLLNTAGRRGATYTLIWVKDGVVYALTGFGNPGEAVTIADSLQ